MKTTTTATATATATTGTVYSLFKGFKKIGEYTSILEAKNEASKEKGVYNLVGEGYRDSWQIVKGLNPTGVARKLERIAKKYAEIEYNEDNFLVGGGLSSEKFASNRHEDAKQDTGKETFGKVCQMFKRATGEELWYVRQVIKAIFPDMEWHHAGKLPKSYGGGMKKTYFLNSDEILYLAENWEKCKEEYKNIVQKEEEEQKERQKKLEQRGEFIRKYAEVLYGIPSSKIPLYFYETMAKMKGKYGWFEADDKYNLPKYYSGYAFESQEKYLEFCELFDN